MARTRPIMTPALLAQFVLAWPPTSRTTVGVVRSAISDTGAAPVMAHETGDLREAIRRARTVAS